MATSAVSRSQSPVLTAPRAVHGIVLGLGVSMTMWVAIAAVAYKLV